jgi:hypothetical protein
MECIARQLTRSPHPAHLRAMQVAARAKTEVPVKQGGPLRNRLWAEVCKAMVRASCLFDYCENCPAVMSSVLYPSMSNVETRVWSCTLSESATYQLDSFPTHMSRVGRGGMGGPKRMPQSPIVARHPPLLPKGLECAITCHTMRMQPHGRGTVGTIAAA